MCIRDREKDWMSGSKLIWKYLKLRRGKNDGYVGVKSQHYGEENFIEAGDPKGRGVHHMAFTGRDILQTDGWSAARFFVKLACRLKKKGF